MCGVVKRVVCVFCYNLLLTMSNSRRRQGRKRNKRMENMPIQEPVFPTYFTLNNGVQMPAIGFCTHRIRKEDAVVKSIDSALESGYRMFDTAAIYCNESVLKTAFQKLLPKYNLKREDIFITTKISPLDHGNRDIVEKAYSKSLKNLGIEYSDLLLIHFPGSLKLKHSDPMNMKLREETWAAMTHIYENGMANAIGVANFTVKHLQQLKHFHGITPTVNQVEWHPYYHQDELLRYCKENDIVLQAYGSLGGASKALLEDSVVIKIAEKMQVSPAQLLLGWSLKQDIAIIQKSTNPLHIRENNSLQFDIPNDYMEALDSLADRNIKYAWDPTDVV